MLRFAANGKITCEEYFEWTGSAEDTDTAIRQISAAFPNAIDVVVDEIHQVDETEDLELNA